MDVEEMLQMQRDLQEKYFDQWGGLAPERAKNSLLWSVIEMGEAADIIKKRGHEAICADERLKREFVEEIGDAIMYLMDALLSFDVGAEEFSAVYREKFERNMRRWEKGAEK